MKRTYSNTLKYCQVGLILALCMAMSTSASAYPAEKRIETEDFTKTAKSHCPPYPAPPGTTVTVSTEAALRSQAANAAPGTTILIASGTYYIQDTIQVLHNNVTIRSRTGKRGDVILDGGGMLTGQTHVIYVDADDVTIADLTIRNAGEHGVSVQGRDRVTLYNLHILDTGYQLVKVNPLYDGSQDGLLACSRLEYSSTAPEDYTNGISAHDAHNWVVRDNEWYRIRTPNNVPAPAILFWSGSSNTLVERNLLVDCYQGIAFGNASHGAGDHSGGVVRNNFIYASLRHDSVIEMVHATGWLVANNTALLLNPEPGMNWGMEARFADTSGTFAYNLTNRSVINRDGAAGVMTGNITSATSAWFNDPAAGDLHLRPTASGAINQAGALAQVSDDFDGETRPIGSAPDVGADEYHPILTKYFRSQGAYDGWTLETTETSGAGGARNAADTVFYVGDNAQDRQYRAILSFNTASLPDDASLARVFLKVKRQAVNGTNPFLTHNNLLADIRRSPFSNYFALQNSDFQSPAGMSATGIFTPTLLSGNWYRVILKEAALAQINKTGVTQFRLRFAKDDNDDLSADFLRLYSGNHAYAANRPLLVVEYFEP